MYSCPVLYNLRRSGWLWFLFSSNQLATWTCHVGYFGEFSGELRDTRRREILERRLRRKSGKNFVVGACEDRPSVVELTRDHRPDRVDEKLRVEAAGGFVVDYGGLPRVNGQLAVSRSIGDIAFKK